MSDKPIKRIKIGLISATIWANKTESNGTRYSISIVRNYRQEDHWKETSSFSMSDLPIVAKVSDMAIAEVVALQTQ